MSGRLEKSLRVRCDLARAFEVFTQRIDLWWPPGHRRFPGSVLTLDASAGGRFVERAENGDEAVLGEVIACTPPHSISYTWHPGALTNPTRVDVTFVADGESTRVEVLHTEGDAALGERWSDRAALFTKGWDAVLAAFERALRAYAEPTANE